MAGSMKWLRAMHGQKCEVCGTKVTQYAVRELRFELVPRNDGGGYAAVKTMATIHCPTCGNAWSRLADGLKPADMKLAVGWLVDRTRRIINPFTKKPIEFGESISESNDGGLCTCDDDDDADHSPQNEKERNADDPVGSETQRLQGDAKGKPPPRGDKRGRLLTQPSIRGCCPPSPITDGTLLSAKRALRCYSDLRTSPSFPRLMQRFGAQVDAQGNPIKKDGDE